MEKIKSEIKWLLENRGSTEIARNTGLSQQSVYKYMRKENPSKIENMTIETAQKLYEYAIAIKKEGGLSCQK